MNDLWRHPKLVVRLQLFWQYFLLAWFAVVTALYLLKADLARGGAILGAGLIAAATVTVVGGLAWQFHKTGHRNSVLLCGVLLVLLAITILTRFVDL